MRKLEYLITGTGRCGTVYLSRCLTDWGIPCGHESIFDYQGLRGAERRLAGDVPIILSVASQMCSSNYVDVNLLRADSSYMAAVDLGAEVLKDTKTIHVVRHPAKVIHSFVNHIDYFKNEVQPNVYESFIYRNIEIGRFPAGFTKAAMFYVLWNELIEEHRDFFLQIEGSLEPLKEFLGVTGEDFPDRTINTFKKPVEHHFDIMDIEDKDVRDRLVAKGEEYGYNMTSKYLLI